MKEIVPATWTRPTGLAYQTVMDDFKRWLACRHPADTIEPALAQAQGLGISSHGPMLGQAMLDHCAESVIVRRHAQPMALLAQQTRVLPQNQYEHGAREPLQNGSRGRAAVSAFLLDLFEQRGDARELLRMCSQIDQNRLCRRGGEWDVAMRLRQKRRLLHREHMAQGARGEAEAMHHARGNEEGEGSRDRLCRILELQLDAAAREQQELRQAMMAVPVDRPAVPLAAAANVLDMDEVRRDGIRFAVKRNTGTLAA